MINITFLSSVFRIPDSLKTKSLKNDTLSTNGVNKNEIFDNSGTN